MSLAKGSVLVTVRVQGGLGNQLFQVAAGYFVSRLNNQNQMRLDVTRIPFGTDATRRFEVGQFNLFPSEFRTSIEGEGVAKIAQMFPRNFGSLIIRGYSWFDRSFSRNVGDFFEDDESAESLESIGSNSVLHGYFNNFAIVEKAESLGFSRNLELRFDPSNWLSNYLNNTDFDETLALHIRLGDYLKFPHIFGSLSEKFYLDCIEQLEVGPESRIIIFSDQPNKVANLLPKISSWKKTQIFRQPNLGASFETFYLMSKFRKIACANSTFSMWAAWFNDVEGTSKLVSVPSPYLLNKEDMVTPASWLKIPRG
jgi:hypothetical protein